MLALLLACSDVEKVGEQENDSEIISLVQLEIINPNGETEIVQWSDPELDGDPEVDEISLILDADYVVNVSFWNGLENPAEDLSPEILDENTEHQIFFGGDVAGMSDSALISHSYSDYDDNSNPIGLENRWLTILEGTGEITVGLRHMPPEAGVETKTENALSDWQEEGEAGIAGDWDALVSFPITVLAE